MNKNINFEAQSNQVASSVENTVMDTEYTTPYIMGSWKEEADKYMSAYDYLKKVRRHYSLDKTYEKAEEYCNQNNLSMMALMDCLDGNKKLVKKDKHVDYFRYYLTYLEFDREWYWIYVADYTLDGMKCSFNALEEFFNGDTEAIKKVLWHYNTDTMDRYVEWKERKLEEKMNLAVEYCKQVIPLEGNIENFFKTVEKYCEENNISMSDLMECLDSIEDRVLKDYGVFIYHKFSYHKYYTIYLKCNKESYWYHIANGSVDINDIKSLEDFFVNHDGVDVEEIKKVLSYFSEENLNKYLEYKDNQKKVINYLESIDERPASWDEFFSGESFAKAISLCEELHLDIEDIIFESNLRNLHLREYCGGYLEEYRYWKKIKFAVEHCIELRKNSDVLEEFFDNLQKYCEDNKYCIEKDIDIQDCLKVLDEKKIFANGWKSKGYNKVYDNVNLSKYYDAYSNYYHSYVTQRNDKVWVLFADGTMDAVEKIWFAAHGSGDFFKKCIDFLYDNNIDINMDLFLEEFLDGELLSEWEDYDEYNGDDDYQCLADLESYWETARFLSQYDTNKMEKYEAICNDHNCDVEPTLEKWDKGEEYYNYLKWKEAC